MTTPKAVRAFLDGIEPEKAAVLTTLLDDVRSVIDPGFDEVINWGMVTFEVPLSVFSDTYNKKPLMYCGFGAQKHHYAAYLMCAYSSSKARQKIELAYQDNGLKLDMGKSCLRFKSLDGVDRKVLKEVVSMYSVAKWVSQYRLSRQSSRRCS